MCPSETATASVRISDLVEPLAVPPDRKSPYRSFNAPPSHTTALTAALKASSIEE
jgi:hypothetical protein